MIASVQVADVGVSGAAALLTRSFRPEAIPGLRNGHLVFAAPLRPTVLPVPQPTRVGLIGFWSDGAAFEEFTATHPVAARLAGGWRAQLEPVRATGSWPGLPDDLGSTESASDLPGDLDSTASASNPSPALVLTLGRLRLGQTWRFLRASARTEAAALAAPGLVWATGLARPPLVFTCSLWRGTADLAAYAHTPGEHQTAVAADRQRPFHHQSAFIRFRPVRMTGHLDGVNPLAESALAPASRPATP